MSLSIKKLKIFISMMSLLASVSAFSDNRDGSSYGMVSCTTSSNGYNFNDESLDRYLAKSQTIAHCLSNQSTNNEECQVNATCDGEYAREMVSCSTTSNGYKFFDESRDSQVSKSHAIAQCVANQSTNNDECSVNVACSDRPSRPMVTCSTSSNGYNFSDETRDSLTSRSHAIAKCVANQSTNNSECNANVSCSDGPARPMISCSTSSNGYRFNDESRDPEVARAETAKKCIANQSTNNAECNANIICDGRGSYNPPRPPRSEMESCTVKRFDPSGMFIQAYTGSGYRGEACEVAKANCEGSIRGRQYCE